MRYDDLSFTTVDEDGLEHINDITNVIPNENNMDEPYVTFTDYSLDEHDEFIQQYGRLVQQNESYYLETKLTNQEIQYIRNQLQDEIIRYVNDTVEESLHE